MLRLMPDNTNPATRLLRYGVAIAVVVLALLLKLLLTRAIGDESPFLLFLSAVMISAWYGGFGPGIVSTMLAALVSTYFFLGPVSSPEAAGTANYVRLALFLIEGGVISAFSGALRRARQAAEEAVRVRDQFLSIAAHELRTPLTALLGYAQVLNYRIIRENSLSERERHAVRVIADQAARIHKLIDSLLDLGRIQAGQFSIERQVVDVVALSRRLVNELQPLLEQHTVEFRGPAVPLLVEGDALRLEQVLQNLLQNAIKYTPAGGPITMHVEQRADQVWMTVCDRGIGIPEAAQPQLFQRFYRADNVASRHTRGMGIGLYVVKELVTLHGGTVEVISTEGQGSAFTVRLPLCTSSRATRPLHHADAAVSSRAHH
jgi:signal transduction histidine kinase